ncbi:MAG: hypothetical protein PHX74_10955 [Candidatus Sumerlaeales bacterium]|nr:hypothetical protein [Candidatus Sumerlaeales bacterium]
MNRDDLPEEAVLFENPEYDNAIIGEDTEGRAVYDFWKMADLLVQRDGMTSEEAVEFVEFNAIRSLPYAGDMAPIVLMCGDDYEVVKV